MTLRQARHRALVGAWVICLATLSGATIVADRVLPTETPFEQQALAEITRLETTRLETAPLRIVVLGDSRMENATRWETTLEDELLAAGLDVVVANLTAAARRSPHYAPLFDDLVAAKPDLVIVPVDTFRLSEQQTDRSLSTRLRRRLGRAQEVNNFGERPCISRTTNEFDDLVWHLGHNLTLLPPSTLDEARNFFDRIAANGGRILLVDTPRSATLLAQVVPLVDGYRRQVLAQFTGDHIVVAPLEPIDDSTYYCDESHLNATGQRLYLETLVPQIVAAIGPAG